MALLPCSIADVTLTITGSLSDTGQGAGIVKYGGAWLEPAVDSNGMQFHVIPVPSVYGTYIGTGEPVLTTPGLYYFGPQWQSFPADTDIPSWSYTLGLGTLVKSFTDGEIEAELRFVTDRDEDGYGVARCYCDDVLVDEYSPSANYTLPDLVSYLLLKNEVAQGIHVGTVAGAVWKCDFSTGNVLVAGDEPELEIEAQHLWGPWVTYLQSGGDADDYRAGRDLFTEGSAYYMSYGVDADGAVYGDEDGFGEILFYQAVFGVPGLALVHHPVSDALLATSCQLGMSAVGVRQHKVQRLATGYKWAAPTVVSDSSNVEWANTLVTASRTDLLLGVSTGLQVANASSLDGAWQTAQAPAVVSNPYGVEAQGRYCVVATSVVSGARRAVFCKLAQEAPYAPVGAQVVIGNSDEVAPSVAFAAVPHLLFAAVQEETGNTKLYASHDQGATWTVVRTVTGLHYPYLFAEDRLVWLVGYEATPTSGATGRLVARRCGASESLPALDAGVVIGPADVGRAAIIRQPHTRELMAIAPKVGLWQGAVLVHVTTSTPELAGYYQYYVANGTVNGQTRYVSGDGACLCAWDGTAWKLYPFGGDAGDAVATGTGGATPDLATWSAGVTFAAPTVSGFMEYISVDDGITWKMKGMHQV